VTFDPIKYIPAVGCGTIVFLIVGFLLMIAADDWVACQIENIENGHFLARNFKKDIVVTSDALSKRMDFIRLEQFETICDIQMYVAGQPYQSNSSSAVTHRPGAARACWGYAPGKLTVLAIDKNLNVAWAQVPVGREEMGFVGPECVDRGRAVLVCGENNCSFGL
jgi:hypothetical protein